MKGPIFGIVVIAAAVLLFKGLFVVDEMHMAVVFQFGKPVKTVQQAGLHTMIPLLQNVIQFDKRMLEWDGEPNQIPTRDKKFIWIDITARWKILDPLQFYKTVRSEFGAQKKLDDIIDGITRDVISNELLIEFVRNTGRALIYSREYSDEDAQGGASPVGKAFELTSGRNEISDRIKSRAKIDVKDLGIDIVDVLVQRVNYTKDVREKVYSRMISERKKVAERYRAEGQGDRARILGRMEKEIRTIRSKSYRTSEEIRGKADAEATQIYAKTYSKDPEFYSFQRTLQNYRSNIDEKTTLLVTTKNDYFQHLNTSR